MALTENRRLNKRDGVRFTHPIAASTKVFRGGILCMNSSGYATKGAEALTLRVLGVALEQVDNTSGSNGDLDVPYEVGVFNFANSSSGDAITAAETGKPCFLVDDQTVAKTDNSGARVVAGIVRGVDDDGVWVELGSHNPTDVVTTAEDLLVATGAGSFKRLAKGTDGQVLKMVSGAIAWAADAT